MTIHIDGTMDVEINGKIERRKFIIECSRDNRLGKAVPVTSLGERIFDRLGSDVPLIVKAE